MRGVLGLGNPGGRYARTRHNIAWLVLAELAARHGAGPLESRDEYEARRTRFGAHEGVLLEPRTFMNASGEALAAWQRRHGWEPAEWLVVSDDVHLPLGMLRLRRAGSSGGHRGLESVEAALGHRQYARLRCGIGEATNRAGLRRWVLGEFAPGDEPALAAAVRLAADAVECWADEGILAAMNRFNRRVRREESES